MLVIDANMSLLEPIFAVMAAIGSSPPPDNPMLPQPANNVVAPMLTIHPPIFMTIIIFVGEALNKFEF